MALRWALACVGCARAFSPSATARPYRQAADCGSSDTQASALRLASAAKSPRIVESDSWSLRLASASMAAASAATDAGPAEGGGAGAGCRVAQAATDSSRNAELSRLVTALAWRTAAWG